MARAQRGVEDSGQHAQQGRLARPVGTQDAHHATIGDELYAAQSVDLLPGQVEAEDLAADLAPVVPRTSREVVLDRLRDVAAGRPEQRCDDRVEP